jgi:NADP-dependent 3-hydroxy acid dehydrogenase YdfG
MKKIALITGATSGIGEACARRYDVITNYLVTFSVERIER